MRRVLHLLMAIALLVSGLHLGEDAHAHESAALHELEQTHPPATDPNDDPGDSHDGTGKVAHAGHHHCPVAPDQDHGPALGAVLVSSADHCSRPAAALSSLTRAPPLEPPAA